MDDLEEDGHWAFQQPANNNVTLQNDFVNENLGQVGEEEALPIQDGSSSITTTVSLSDEAFSNNIQFGGNPLNEEVNQMAHNVPINLHVAAPNDA